VSRKKSYLTFTDQFCGAGGSTIGAKKVGLEGRMALNHWKLAIETHLTNHPEIAHDCTDISACDPKRYPATDLLITSPECTTHSPAGGSRRAKPQRDLFLAAEDPATARSRATMWDVPRFAEFHEYNLIIVENVVEAYTQWPLFATWLQAMHVLGYDHKIVCLNSMFCHPTPQSRDRLYVVFWRKGNRAPKLDFRPPAYCMRCEKDVRGRQTWKNGRAVGKYRTQYIYTCPTCRSEVQPFYFAALNALDLSLPAQRIGDRSRALRPRTLDRIRFGLEKYGNRSLLVTTNQTNRLGGRVRTTLHPHFTQPACNVTGLVQPHVLVDTGYSHSNSRRTRGLEEPLPSQTAQLSAALVGLPFITNAGSNSAMCGADDPMPTQTCTERLAAVLPAAVVTQRGNPSRRGLDEPLQSVCTNVHHMLVQGSALLTLRDSRGVGYLLRTLDEALGTQVASCSQDALISRVPFIASQYRTHNVSPIDHAVPTLSTVDRHALVSPGEEISVDDCYFRMLQPHEIGAAMAFPEDYVVLGNKRDKVKQFGNAVTPPVMEWLIRQATASLAPEVAA
jgi:DNA (cytosine-5)-methyltransferase 1